MKFFPFYTTRDGVSFQAWVNIIGGILEHNFVEDFLGNAQTLQEQDDDALQWAAFLHAWREHYRFG